VVFNSPLDLYEKPLSIMFLYDTYMQEHGDFEQQNNIVSIRSIDVNDYERILKDYMPVFGVGVQSKRE